MPTLRKNLVLHSRKYGNIIRVYVKHRNRLLLLWLSLSCTHSSSSSFLLFDFDLHKLLQECCWGIQQGLGIVTCNTEDLLVIDLVCVFLEVSLTALYFRVTYCPTFRACTPLMQVPYVPQSLPRALRNIRHLHEWGTSSEGGAVSHSEIKCCKKHTHTRSITNKSLVLHVTMPRPCCMPKIKNGNDRVWKVAGICECGNEPSGSIKCG